MKPTIGRIVHYHSYGTPGGEFTKPRAAVVTAVNDNGTVDLFVMNPTGVFLNRNVSAGGPEAMTPTPGCWNWPPREEPAARIAELEDALNEIYHYTDSTTGQMEIIDRVLPQKVEEAVSE